MNFPFRYEQESLLQPALDWFESMDWSPQEFQLDAWRSLIKGNNGLINAPTGSGKTYACWLGILLRNIHLTPAHAQQRGLRVLWITPIRALAAEIKFAATRACEALGVDWQVGIRTGDTSNAERNAQRKLLPELLITTPESLHLLLAQSGYPDRLNKLQVVVADEWHEVMGSKRAVLLELALSRLRGLCPDLLTWGISATIGNMEEAIEVLLGPGYDKSRFSLIKADLQKEICVSSILPDEIETFPWSGHLGIRLLDKVIPLIRKSKTSLIFTNTRSQTEIWYQRILAAAPELAGQLAMHHGSISRELRAWVEEALHQEKLKAVVCTSSLDLGVDFRPVETIIQIGSPKGVARFMQRAGRSGHAPGKVSHIWFVPTHSLELVEGAALRQAIEQQTLESRLPYLRSFDVLCQYLVTLAVSEGFREEEIWDEVTRTYSFASISREEWWWVLQFITSGGGTLDAYDEFHKVRAHQGVFRVIDRRTARHHRMSIGTIVGDNVLEVRYANGSLIGTIEEWFIAKINPGESFWFAGRNLELVHIRDLKVTVRNSRKKTGKFPSWMGGRLPLSSQLAHMIRKMLHDAAHNQSQEVEVNLLKPLFKVQQKRSHLPMEGEILMEYFETSEGHHLLIYPFEGRLVHEGLSTLIAYRMSLLKPLSFSLAYNDYGLELLSDQELPIQEFLDNDLFTEESLFDHLMSSVNTSELARRKFRDIAHIAGMIFQGFPGKRKSAKHMQSSTSMLFNVFRDYDPANMLLKQAFEEVMEFELEEQRLRAALRRIQASQLIVTYPSRPTPFSFPIMVDRLRERFTTETLEQQIEKMTLAYSEDDE